MEVLPEPRLLVAYLEPQRRVRKLTWYDNSAICTKDSLPVLTMANPNRLSRSGVYLGRVVEQLFEYLLESHNYLGVGRLFLP
jgi:hypothetical protein